MQQLVAYNDDGDVPNSDVDSPPSSPLNADAKSDGTASILGSPPPVVHPDVANLLRGGAAAQPSVDLESNQSSAPPEAQGSSELSSQHTDYGAAFSPVAMCASVDTDALHVELAAARRENELLKSELKKAQLTIKELKGRLESNSQKRSSMSKELSELRVQMQATRIEVSKAAARTDAVLQAVDMMSKHDTALEAQAKALCQMHADLQRYRKMSLAYLDKHKAQVAGSSGVKSQK